MTISSFSSTSVITAPAPKVSADSPSVAPTGSFCVSVAASLITSGMIFFKPLVLAPYTALSVTTSAASLPASTAPSIEPKNFWLVQSPAKVKLEMGVLCDGRYLFRPGIAAYTDRGVLTTACFRKMAPTPSGDPGPISRGNKRSSSTIVASTISWLDLAIQLVLPPAIGEHGANTSSSMDFSASAYSLTHSLMSAYTLNSLLREKTSPS
mmetsp:Transcript_7632/g.28577  ORF Transcript_7632/g.28577 Transcript_7632/m.28577 type:complete len:209 (+) Transcript_7632:149-775(+)